MSESLGGIEVRLDTRLRTYEDHRTNMLRLAQQFTPEWTDFYPHDPGVVLVEVFAATADIMSDYIDRAVAEAHWSTAQRRTSLVNMANLIGYTPHGPVSSTVLVDVTTSGPTLLPGLDSIGQQPFRIGGSASAGQPVFEFELLEETTVNGTESLVFIEGTTILQEVIGSSSGNSGQFFTASRSPVTTSQDGAYSLTVEVFDGLVWTAWTNPSDNNFFASLSTDEHFIYEITSNNFVVIRFGDGTNGKIPIEGEDNIRLSYRIGGGSQANFIPIGRLSQIKTSTPGVLTVTNTDYPSGGDDAETVDEIRQNAPSVFASGNRVVTQNDYIALARSIPGVHKVKVSRYEGSPLVQAVYVAANGINPVPTGTWNFRKQSGTGMLGSVGSVLLGKMVSTLKLQVLPIIALSIIVDVDVHVRRNYSQSQVRQRVLSAITDYVTSVDNTDIPDLLSFSGFVDSLHSVEGVQYVDVNKFYRVPYLEEQVIGYADTVLSDVLLRNTIMEDTIVVEFQDSTTFTVESTNLGLQANMGVLGTMYSTDDGTLSFTLTAGTYANNAGDRYKILVSDYKGNIVIQAHEIPVLDVDPVVTMIGGIPR